MPPVGYEKYDTAKTQLPEIAGVKQDTALRMQGIMYDVWARKVDGGRRFRPAVSSPKLESPKVYYDSGSLPPGHEVCAWLDQTGRGIRLFTVKARREGPGRYTPTDTPVLRAETIDGIGPDLEYHYSQEIYPGESLTDEAQLQYARDVLATVELIAGALYTPSQS